MDKRNEIWLLMSRCLSGEATKDEQQKFADLLSEDTSLQHQFSFMQAYWKGAEPASSETNESSLDAIFQKAEATVRRPGSFLKKRILQWAIAASLVPLAFWGIMFFKPERKLPQQHTAETKQLKQVLTPAGSRMKTMLPDGSVVWLNADSKLTYSNNDFSSETREVTLDGEGFFDVKKDTRKPFIVHAGRINIKVLGTVFNVRSYSSDKNIETTLLRGKIEISQPSFPAAKKIILHPHEKLTLPTTAPAIKTSASEPISVSLPAQPVHIDKTLKDERLTETAWLYNRLEFRNEDFETIAHKMERWYNVKISFRDEASKKLDFNGSFEKETLEEALEALQKASPSFTFKIENHEIFIRSSQ